MLAPIVDFITKLKIFKQPNFSRGFSVTLIYILIIAILFIISASVFPHLYHEILKIGHDLPRQFKFFRTETLAGWVGALQEFVNENNFNINVKQHVDDTIGNILKSSEIRLSNVGEQLHIILGGLFNALTTFLIIFIFTAFVLVDLPKIQKSIVGLVPITWKDEAGKLITSINRDLSGTIRGQLLICLINGILTTIGLMLLQIKYAITVGIIAGAFSLIPVFGAIISSIPAVIIALTQGWHAVVGVIIVIIIIHLIEANFLNPKIMGHTVDLHPAIIIFALIIGENFFGIAGLLLAVPTAAMVRSILTHFYTKFFDVQDDIME